MRFLTPLGIACLAGCGQFLRRSFQRVPGGRGVVDDGSKPEEVLAQGRAIKSQMVSAVATRSARSLREWEIRGGLTGTTGGPSLEPGNILPIFN